MIWFQNSTNVFAIIKAPDNLAFPLFLVGPFMTEYLKHKGILESADQLTFGQVITVIDICLIFLLLQNS